MSGNGFNIHGMILPIYLVHINRDIRIYMGTYFHTKINLSPYFANSYSDFNHIFLRNFGLMSRTGYVVFKGCPGTFTESDPPFAETLTVTEVFSGTARE